jgi:hypothetical protein
MARMRLYLDTVRVDGMLVHRYVADALRAKAKRGAAWRTPAQRIARALKRRAGAPLRVAARELARAGDAGAIAWCGRKGIRL